MSLYVAHHHVPSWDVLLQDKVFLYFTVTEFQKCVLQLLVDIRNLVKDMEKKYEPNNPSLSIEQVLTLLQFQKLEEDLQQPEKKEELVYWYSVMI